MDQTRICPDVRGELCTETRPEPCGLIIFGASGDLTHRKLIPALFSLYKRELMPSDFFILGCARTPMTDEEFQRKVRDSIASHSSDSDASGVDVFVSRCVYHAGDYQNPETYSLLVERLKKLDKEHFTGLPIPAAAVTIASYFLFSREVWLPLRNPSFSVGLVIALSVLMVSTLEYDALRFSLDSWWGRCKLVILLGGALTVALFPSEGLFPLNILYAGSGIVRWIAHLIGKEQAMAGFSNR